DFTQGVISTTEGMAMLDMSEIDVLIRADGGVGLPPMTSFAPSQILLRKKNQPESPSNESRHLLADFDVRLPPMTSFTQEQIILREKNLPERPASEPRLLLVDFDDRHHPLLRRWSRQRRAAYAERGWYAPGVDPLQERIERFLIGRE